MRAGSKFTLVTLGATRARQINAYFNQLGDGQGGIPPQVASVARKPLSIAFEEIAEGLIVPTFEPEPRSAEAPRPTPTPPTARAERPRPRGGPRDRRRGARRLAASSSASPGASPPTRRSRSAAASSTPAPTSRPSSPRARCASSARTTFDALASRAGPRRRCGTTSTRSRTPGSARPPTS